MVRSVPRPPAQPKTRETQSRRANLCFPVGTTANWFQLFTHGHRVKRHAPVLLTALLEEVCRGLLVELDQIADQHHKKRITNEHLRALCRSAAPITAFIPKTIVYTSDPLPAPPGPKRRAALKKNK